MDLSLTGKNAVVCGSTQGIGLASAVELAQLGATVVLVARNQETLSNAVQTLPAEHGQNHQSVVADFSKPEDVKSAAESISQQMTVHILVNNSGGPPGGPITDAAIEEFHSAFSMHLVCNHLLTQVFSPGMKEAQFGRIINIISTSVKQPLNGLGVSNTIRGAVASWAKTMANELGKFGITVNNVLPGATETARLSSILENKAKKTGCTVQQAADQMKSAVPAARFGKPEELGAAVAFLASPSAGYINGINLPVDGGRTSCL